MYDETVKVTELNSDELDLINKLLEDYSSTTYGLGEELLVEGLQEKLR